VLALAHTKAASRSLKTHSDDGRAREVKHVDVPADMQRSMARQAEAEREKRAKIITPKASWTRRPSWRRPRA
jgi:hypothetical protein